ncbi:U3 small nucleolar RNA-associated protein 25 homolog isoform X2 [Denticeps clupeoides]|uniref:U3 small nucleolar RNA-associated protein 25 homolog isoform X2 n=1 Tax=Denticeps clupeoides TaxID=299321 RepID=UPI0010A2A9A7|nr:digestive organ expansion factor homolog isoform X2 [Denticeps clupeoides]
MGKRRHKNEAISKLTKKQRKHLQEFGEQHPFHDQVAERAERTQVLKLHDSPKRVETEGDDEEEEEEERPSAYQKLLFTLKQSDDVESDEDEEEILYDEGIEEVDEEDGTGVVEEDLSPAEEHPRENAEGEIDGGELEETKRSRAEVEEFMDKKHEAQFCLETNVFGEEDMDNADDMVHQDGYEDTFVKHLETELDEEDIRNLLNGVKKRSQIKWPRLSNMLCISNLEKFPAPGPASGVSPPPLHKALEANWKSMNQPFQAKGAPVQEVSSLQKELLGLMGTYRDVYFPECSPITEGKEVRSAYCLHVLNHVLKANSRVLAHNAQLKESKPGEEDFRDKGLTRPKVLILVPFRDGALQVVQTFVTLLEPKGKKMDVSNKKRFKDEFGEVVEDRPPNLVRPDDYHAVFSGNVDDHFRIGVSILKRSMRLYSPFYSSDIIIASPLGLRTLLGVDGESKRDFDFLSSIEILVLDQADVFFMQNWEHVLMTICHLFHFQVATKNLPKTGSICQVLVQLPHVFQMFNSDSFMDQDARFQFFVDKVLPQYKDSVMSHTFIYVPSYFDFVRIRNYLKKEDVNFTSISEYSNRSEVYKARHFFQKGDKQFLLFSERFHFYKRYTIKGIRNLIFYGLPTYAHFYSEVCNMLQTGTDGRDSSSWTCTVLYSRYDAHKLAAVTGAERAAQMLQSKKPVHLFVTGEEDKAS